MEEKEIEKTEIVLDRKFSGSVFLFFEKKLQDRKKIKSWNWKKFFPVEKKSIFGWFFSFSFGKTFFEPIPKGVI